MPFRLTQVAGKLSYSRLQAGPVQAKLVGLLKPSHGLCLSLSDAGPIVTHYDSYQRPHLSTDSF
jgi:hypothetical protein